MRLFVAYEDYNDDETLNFDNGYVFQAVEIPVRTAGWIFTRYEDAVAHAKKLVEKSIDAAESCDLDTAAIEITRHKLDEDEVTTVFRVWAENSLETLDRRLLDDADISEDTREAVMQALDDAESSCWNNCEGVAEKNIRVILGKWNEFLVRLIEAEEKWMAKDVEPTEIISDTWLIDVIRDLEKTA